MLQREGGVDGRLSEAVALREHGALRTNYKCITDASRLILQWARQMRVESSIACLRLALTAA